MSKEKDVTIYDLATELGVSVATISRALKNDPVVKKNTRNKIFDLAVKWGYRSNHFARNLRTQETNTIGFMIHELNSNFSNAVLSGVERITTQAGYDLIIAHSSESYDKEVANARNLFHKRVDGLIASLSFDTQELDHFDPFLEKSVPVIFFDRVEKTKDNTIVIIDNFRAGYEATRHLIEQGCARIAHITSNLTRNVYAERLKGYRAALEDHQLPFDETLIIVDNLSENAGIESAEKILAWNPRPDGAFITNDFVAAAFIKTIQRHRLKVPRDLAVVGFNNDAIAHLIEPSLSTVNYPGIEMGEIAARTLINHLKGTSNINQINTVIINAELIVRDSSLKSQKKTTHF